MYNVKVLIILKLMIHLFYYSKGSLAMFQNKNTHLWMTKEKH